MALLNYSRVNVLTIHFAGCEPCILMPGINEVSAEILKLLLVHPSVNALIREGKLVVIEDQKTSDGKRSVNDMLAYIPKIFDTKLLKKIIKDDGRDQVVQAAKDQLDTIVNPKKPEQGKEENEHFQ